VLGFVGEERGGFGVGGCGRHDVKEWMTLKSNKTKSVWMERSGDRRRMTDLQCARRLFDDLMMIL
jgi:hypothetical protein